MFICGLVINLYETFKFQVVLMQLCKLLCAEIKSAGAIKHVACWFSRPMLASIMLAMERFDLFTLIR